MSERKVERVMQIAPVRYLSGGEKKREAASLWARAVDPLAEIV